MSARPTPAIDRFADALADTGGVPAFAALLGLNQDYANNLFAKIRREFGSRAV